MKPEGFGVGSGWKSVRRWRQFGTVAAALMLSPIPARADSGTPLLMLGAFHLVVLNALIGVVEGLLIAALFRGPFRRSMLGMVPANYVSVAVGWPILAVLAGPVEHVLPGRAPLFRIAALIVTMVALAWLLSVVIEWPFVWWSLRSAHATAWTALRASALAQTASYALLVPLYLSASPLSMVTSAHIQADLAFVRAPVATVYYIDPRDHNIHRIRTDGTGKSIVCAAPSRDPDARLVAEDTQNGRVTLRAIVQDSSGSSGHVVPVSAEAPGVAVPEPERASPETTRGNFGRVLELEGDREGEWSLREGFWPDDGISVYRKHRFCYNLAFATPFDGWPCRNARILPTGQAVFQLGYGSEGQIVILDLATRNLGLVAMGVGPVVILDANRQSPPGAVAGSVSVARHPSSVAR